MLPGFAENALLELPTRNGSGPVETVEGVEHLLDVAPDEELGVGQTPGSTEAECTPEVVRRHRAMPSTSRSHPTAEELASWAILIEP